MMKFQEEQAALINDEKRAELMTDAPAPAASGQDDFLTVGSRDKAVKKGTIVLAILFAVGLAALVFMIKKSVPSSAAAGEEAQKKNLQAAMAQVLGIKKELAGDMQPGLIYELSDVEKKQIKVSELKKNPFMLDKAGGEQAAAGGEGGEAAQPVRVVAQVNGLRLLGIMLSPTGNSCMINDRIVYKGDKVSGYQVLAINDDSVELSSQGTTVTLRIATGK
jgi:hypothetical protein